MKAEAEVNVQGKGNYKWHERHGRGRAEDIGCVREGLEVWVVMNSHWMTKVG